MRILHVIPSLLPGGAERLITEWATYLRRAGHEVELCTIYTGGPFVAQLERAGVAVHNLAFDPGIEQFRLRRKYDLRILPALARRIRDGKFQIVHAHLFPALLFAALTSFLAPDQPYVYSEHSQHNRRRRSRILRVLDWCLYYRYARILPVGHEVAKALCAWLPGLTRKVQVIPNAIDPAHFQTTDGEVEALRRELTITQDEKVVLFVGRLEHEKGPDLLVEALSHLHPSLDEENSRIRVVLAGDGRLKKALQERCSTLPRAGMVTFLGYRQDIPALLGLADLVVLPSRSEGLPMTVLETMAAGKPLLATSVGSIPEVIEHGVSGWVVPPGSPAALAQGIRHLLGSPDLRKRLSDRALNVLQERYTLEVTMPTLLEAYASVM